ncbi:GDSL-type esterase/lipase family protein [Corallococcus interemptor]|uniref:GDSL-type esterase/lipase family protein n=1 Tax=Corallococcus interemptor TaxID=2316720 RepID=UPI003D033EDA
MTVLDVSRGLWRAGLLAVLAGALLPGCESRTPPHRFPLTTTPATDSVPAPPGAGATRPTSEASPPSARPEPAVVPASASLPAPAASKPRRSEFRALPPTSERGGQLHALATRLKAPGGRVEDPCLETDDTGCARSALTPFYTALDGLLETPGKTPTVIAAFGNSLIAGDRIVDVVREDLTAGFGDGGRGVLLVDRMAPYGGRNRTAAVSHGWQPRTLGELKAPPHPFGITGVYHLATEDRARGRFKLEGEPRGTLWWKDVKGAGRLVVSVDGAVLARTEPRGDGASRTTSFELPAGAKWLDVTAEGRGAIVQGVVLQKDEAGIVLDMLGVPSADATLYARLEEDALKAQLQQRDPKLLLFFLGGNESKRLEWKRTDLPTVRQDLAALLRRTRAAAPGSACLVVGPMDAVQDGHAKGKPLTQRPFLVAAIQAEREVALAEGCGFFDLYAAMGGAGSLARFNQAGFMHEDLVHPRGHGLDLLGQLVSDALLAGWVDEGAVPAPALKTASEDAPASSASSETAEAVP